ncbi:MAG: FKBP-type peptidyl-prolyl cis-trans isomerase [Sumerlaeia bacterium]
MKKSLSLIVLLTACAFAGAGCGKEEAATTGSPSTESPAAANSAASSEKDSPATETATETTQTTEETTVETIEKENGLKIEILEQGTGPKPQQGQVVAVHYVGTLASDGSEFDNSRKRGAPIEFPLGVGKVIPGWDQGIAELNQGSKARLTIPYSLGYGERGFPGAIPPRADLIFEVELVDIK